MQFKGSLNLQVVYRDVDILKGYAKNARKHTAHKYDR